MSAVLAPFERSPSRLPRPAPWADAPVLLLTACDRIYLPHAIALARSLEAFAPGSHLLIHLVNPDAQSLETLAAHQAALRALHLHVSTEKVRLPSEASKAAYYASARFFRMAELLRAPNAVPVLALDADALAVSALTLDFSDKAETEICLRRREPEDATDTHLQVAAGAVWARPTPRARQFFDALAVDLATAFASGDGQWFVDQKVLAKHVEASTANAKIRNIKSKFADWNFGEDAVFWMGKGDRKYFDVRYLLLRDGFDESPLRRDMARELHARYRSLLPAERPSAVMERAQRLFQGTRALRAAIFLPRLDLPWKRSGLGKDGMPPLLSADTIELRLWWKRFSMSLAHALTRAGVEPRLVEIPAWEITPERVDGEDVDLAFVAHRSRLEFASARTPLRFFMQEYFRPVFVLDALGWSAGSSVYPVDADALPPAVLGAWDDYRAAMLAGTLASKFGQVARSTRVQLQAAGELPRRPYIFMPLQLPHDQSVTCFSDVGMDEALDATVALASAEGVALVLKAHPANMASMAAFRERHRGNQDVSWTEAHIHDAITYALGTVTINSGSGFEALLAGGPVVCLGRVEYDAAAHAARIDNLQAVWRAAVNEVPATRMRRYSRFVDWFLGRHAIDLSRPFTSQAVLDRHVRAALDEAGHWRARGVAG